MGSFAFMSAYEKSLTSKNRTQFALRFTKLIEFLSTLETITSKCCGAFKNERIALKMSNHLTKSINSIIK